MHFKSMILIAFLLATPAVAQQGPALPHLRPYTSIGFYDVSWGGISVGGMVIDAREFNDSYAMEVRIKSSGIAWTFTKHKSTTTMEGIKQNGAYIPQKFETDFKLRGKTRHIVLEYNEQGELVHEINTPPEDPNKRPPVPMELKQNALDALTPFFLQRIEVYDALKSGGDNFTIRMFDGRRLTDMHYFIQGRKRVEWNRQETPVIHFNLTRTPVAGYKKDELNDIHQNKDPAVSLYLSDDGRLIPLKIIIDSSAGKFHANFKQNCLSMADCLTLLK